MTQKHYIDIENLREQTTEFVQANTTGFEVGDVIQVTEKFDGANACLAYDVESDEIKAFSRKQELAFNNNLSGFWNFGQNLSEKQVSVFKLHPNWRVFGEWSGNKNKIIYADTGKVKHWYVFDIYDISFKCWLTQDKVKQFCADAELEYINVLYEGPFISWDHIKSFMNKPFYGERQEGVVVKNQTKLLDPTNVTYTYLKVVNESFKESMKIKVKVIDPEVEKAKAQANELTGSIVTRNRVEKELYKMRDEGLLPEILTPAEMGLVAKILPKRIYEDCVKEENHIVKLCGEYFSKCSNTFTMQHARSIILGDTIK